jgi:hypothetical protein
MASILGVETLQHTNGTTAATIDSSGKVAFIKPTNSIAVLEDVKAYNVEGGAATAGWQDRTLNTETLDPDGIVTLSSNQFTLGAGTYIIEFSAPAYEVNRHVVQLYNVTDSSVEENGRPMYANNSNNVMNISEGIARVVLTGNKTFKIRHNIAVAKNNGLGLNSGLSGVDSIYTRVIIYKLA